MIVLNAHIQTYTGREINPLQLQLGDIDIVDIAHSLSCINRFNGHTRFPINVAQHSVYCAMLCRGTGFELQALLHDASEAYLGDVTKWLKHTSEMQAFREAEDRAQSVIFTKFGCPIIMADAVEEADRIMVRFEGVKGFGPDFKIHHPNYSPLTSIQTERVNFAGTSPWLPWSWSESRERFLMFFNQYLKEYDVK